MLVKLLIYGYAQGKTPSRKLERSTYEEVPYRVLTGNHHPDHDSIAAFCRRHLSALAGLFTQVLRLCREAGLVKLGHVALDGSKIKASASKRKAMSYARLCRSEEELRREVGRLLAEAEREDREEDCLKEEQTKERERKEAARGRRFGGKPPHIPDPVTAAPKPAKQKNFTDPESCLMKDGATGGYTGL